MWTEWPCSGEKANYMPDEEQQSLHIQHQDDSRHMLQEDLAEGCDMVHPATDNKYQYLYLSLVPQSNDAITITMTTYPNTEYSETANCHGCPKINRDKLADLKKIQISNIFQEVHLLKNSKMRKCPGNVESYYINTRLMICYRICSR